MNAGTAFGFPTMKRLPLARGGQGSCCGWSFWLPARQSSSSWYWSLPRQRAPPVAAAVADNQRLMSEPTLSITSTASPRRRSEKHGGARAWLWTTVVATAGPLIAVAILAPGRSTAPTRGVEWLLFVGSSVHVASTGWLYTLPDVRWYALHNPKRYVWVPLGLIAAGAVGAAALSTATISWLLLPYFAWQFFHFQKQNVGMAALAAASNGLMPLSRLERRALVGAGVAGIGGLVADPQLLQLGVHAPWDGFFKMATLMFVAAVGTGLLALFWRPRGARPIGFTAIYVLSLVFSLPVFVFRSPYAAVGGMTIAHGFQYLVLIGLVAAGSTSGTGRAVKLAVLGNVALVGGALLSGASHLHGSALFLRPLFGAYLGAVMAHFVVDAGLWRLRDPFPRAFLGTRLPYLVPTRPMASPTDGSSADIK